MTNSTTSTTIPTIPVAVPFNNSLCSMHRNTHSNKLILGVALVT